MYQQTLIVKSNGLYYEFDYQIYQGLPEKEKIQNVSLEKDFRETNLKNIIQCGIYDILIYEKNVKIFNNMNPLNELKELIVSNDALNMLKSQKFIQQDDHSIVCLRGQPVNFERHIVQIDVSSENLVEQKRDSDQYMKFQTPWQKNDIKNCKFELLKYKQLQYAAFIVTSPNQMGSFYQYYKFKSKQMCMTLAFMKPLKDFITLQQIPHLPFVTSDGHLFINCEMYQSTDYEFQGKMQKLDLIQDECEILNQDQLNIHSQDLEVYETSFKKSLFRFIEAKENFLDQVVQSDQKFYSIEIPEIKTFVNIRQDAISSDILIFCPSLNLIKHFTLTIPMHYLTHKVIYRDISYYVSIILQTKDNALYEVWISFSCFWSFDIAGVTLEPFNFITKLKESQKLNQSYLSDDLTLSLLINDNEDFNHASVCCFRKSSLNQKGDIWSEQVETFKFHIANDQIQPTAQQVSAIIQRIAQRQSFKIGDSFLKDFVSIIKKYSQIEVYDGTYVFAFLNKIMLFQSEWDNLKILDDQLSLISTVSLNLMSPLISIASVQDSGMLEYVDQFNNKFAFPTICNSQDSDSQNELLNRYSKDFRYPRPFFFGLHDALITHLDLNKNKLFFYKSEQDKKDLNAYARIEIIREKSSFIDKIFETKERIQLEHEINKIDMNLLFSYNINKRVNLITGTKNHSEKDHIYGILYKKLEIAEIKELPMLIYNTSLVSNIYETILDVLIDNKAIKLAQLIISISIKQDPLGYFQNRLGPYLFLFSSNELQIFLDSHIFFFQIPADCYEDYQIQDETFITPISDYQNFAEIKKNMREIERKMLQIEEVNIEEQKDHHHSLERKEEKLQISERFAIKKKQPVPIEYFAINLMQLIKSKKIPIKENHRQVTQMLNQLVEKDATILERESIQIIIDFKWDSYAWKFFSVQLFLFICFIMAFIFDIVGVSNNSHVFSSKDSSQIIPRIISIAIIIPFAIYEVANIKADIKRKFTTFWNLNDLLFIVVYATYFPITFAKPDQDYLLKALQLLIVIFSFIKFTFLIRIWTQVSFLVRMLIVVFKELLIFLLFFLLVLGGLTVMAQIIIKESGDGYAGIKTAAFFVIVLRQAIGDYDTSSIIEGTRGDFKILAWLFWLLILIIGNIVFMNFIIAVVSESYESCMEQKVQLIYKAKLEMIEECEDLMPQWLFTHREWFPRFLIVRRQQGSSNGAGGDNSDEWQGFVKQIKRQLKQETAMLNDIFTQNIKRSSDQTKKALDEVKNDMNAGLEEVKKVTAEVKVLREQMNEFKEILSAVYKDKLPAINSK